jgi:Zn finger protein HypA/HybF involved in hydrogenase expression
MHEMSLALEICRIAEDHVGREALVRVREVGLSIGADAGVVPDSLEFCLESLFAGPPWAGARVAMDRVEGSDLRLTYLEVDDAGSPD